MRPATAILLALLTLGCDSQVDQNDRMTKYSCQRHLANIYTALRAYADQNDGVLPDGLEALVERGHLAMPPESSNDRDLLMCIAAATPNGYVTPQTLEQWAASVRNGHITYRLCAPRSKLDTKARTPLVVEIEAYHLDGGFVLYADGSIELLSELELARVGK